MRVVEKYSVDSEVLEKTLHNQKCFQGFLLFISISIATGILGTSMIIGFKIILSTIFLIPILIQFRKFFKTSLQIHANHSNSSTEIYLGGNKNPSMVFVDDPNKIPSSGFSPRIPTSTPQPIKVEYEKWNADFQTMIPPEENKLCPACGTENPKLNLRCKLCDFEFH